jgi:hypothetical protein
MQSGPLHLMAKRNDVCVSGYRERRRSTRGGAMDADVTRCTRRFAGVMRRSWAAPRGGADPAIRDSKHDGDVKGWSNSSTADNVRILEDHANG